MRVAPHLVRSGERETVAAVIARDRHELIALLDMLADGIEGQSEFNVNTGALLTYVEPEWFPRFKVAMARYCDRAVLKGVPLARLRVEG